MMSATILTSKRHHYTSYYYNFHHFRWKAHHKISISSSEANVEMETRKNSENRNHAYYKSTMSASKERKHKRTHQHQSYLPFQPVMTFGSFILMLSIFLLLTSNRAVYCEEKLSVTEALDFEDFPQQPSRSVEIKNCFSLERKKSWPRAIVYENSTASVNIDLSRIDSSVLECIKGQMGQESTNNIEGTLYQISIVLKHKKDRTLVDASDSTLVLSSSQIWYKSKAQRKSLSQSRDDYKEVDDNFSLQRSTITFPYILFSGIYRIQFHVCDDKLILEENLIKNSDTRNKQIGDLEEEYNSIASYDSDQNTSSTTSNKTSEDKRNLLFTNLKTSDNIKTQKQRSCRIHNPTETVVESKNIIVEKDFKLKNWCTISSKRQKDLKYFVLNDSQDSSIMSIGNQIQNTNDSSSSDIILNVENSLPDQTFNSQDHSAISISRPEASSKNALSFKFSFNPCHELFPYETATVMVYSVKSNDLQNTDISLPENENQTESNENETFSTKISLNESALKNKCGKTINGTNLHPVHVQKSVKISRAEDGRSVIAFVTPELERSAHYCAITTSNHRLCTNSAIAEKATGEQHSLEFSNESKIPQFCQPMSSEWKYVISYKDDLPFIATYVPFCTTHFRCGWLYILVVGSVAFLTSCLLAVCFVHCCCRTTRQHIAIPLKQEDAQTFDTICLNDPENINSNHDGVDGSTMPVLPQKTWTEMHDEFYAEPPKNPGKILLLYSPDTKQFKELQKAFRNFLEMACHCVVLDLFDEALFQTICYDPEKWLANLLKDRHFKIIVVCSEGAFKRQHALINGEVLNIPKYDNSSLDGLFSAGLKFIQQNHAYDHRRLTLVRYESLALTKPEHKLTMMTSLDAPGSNRISKTEVDEYIVTSQLPELFCWIHDIPDGRDYRLVGRPWDKYHLELQLLRDELKSARNERRSTIIK